MTRAPLALYAVVAIIQLTAQATNANGIAGITQALLMPILALHLVLAGSRTRLTNLTLVALGFSWIGDLVPRFLPGDAAFAGMIGAFLCAQVTYLAAYLPYRQRSVLRRPQIIPYVAALGVLEAVCLPNAGTLAPAVVAYGLCLVSMAVLASGVNRLTTIGGAVFVVSDGLIAVDAFVDGWQVSEPVQDTAVMATYIVAQLLLTLGARCRETESQATGGAERQSDEISP